MSPLSLSLSLAVTQQQYQTKPFLHILQLLPLYEVFHHQSKASNLNTGGSITFKIQELGSSVRTLTKREWLAGWGPLCRGYKPWYTSNYLWYKTDQYKSKLYDYHHNGHILCLFLKCGRKNIQHPEMWVKYPHVRYFKKARYSLYILSPPGRAYAL